MQFSADTDVFGKTFACACGKTHRIEPREVVYNEHALDQLPGICARAAAGRRAVVLMDERTRAVAGCDACRRLAHDTWRVVEVVVPDGARGGTPVCDDITKDLLYPRAGEADLIVSVGSGVINDLGKWIAGDMGVPFVCFATAASMNGYASANVAPTVAGVKTLVRARPAVAVAAVPEIIENAPSEMTASGLGDVLAKSVSSTDWRLNHLLFDDYYCARSVGLIADIEPLYLDHPADLKTRTPRALAALFKSLLLTGAAMTMAETSAPSSGGEHMIGHTLDMMSSVDGVPHDLHGRQVGVGTVLASELYRRVLALESPEFAAPCASVDKPFWGALAEVVAAHYAEKGDRMVLARDTLKKGNAWDRLREELAPMLRPPEKVRACLSGAGAAFRAKHIGCTRERLLAALLHGHEIRSRFTILDLARVVGLMPSAAAGIVEAWA